jgi:hypothetical protein
MKKKQQLNEEEQLNEFLGSLVKAIFKTKATALGKAAFADPVLHKAFQQYIDDTNKFKAKLKKRGISDPKALRDKMAAKYDSIIEE